MATKDAAFHAYVALYGKGLVNDNLLPLLGHDDEMPVDVETRDAFEDVAQTADPWASIAREWANPELFLFRTVISIQRPQQHTLCIDMISPHRFGLIHPHKLYWDETTTYAVSILESSTAVDPALLPSMREATSLILQSIHTGKIASDADDFLFLFVPGLEQASLASWVEASSGVFPASELRTSSSETPCGLIREPSLFGAPHILVDFADVHGDAIKVRALPKRRNFLHHGNCVRQKADESEPNVVERHAPILPLRSSTVDRLHPDSGLCRVLPIDPIDPISPMEELSSRGSEKLRLSGGWLFYC
jgi:hypothetical protein